MKRTIVALAALGMLATAGSVRAGGFGSYSDYNLYGTFVETFQGSNAGFAITGLCQISFDGSGHLLTSGSASQCFTDNGATNGCTQNFTSGSYNVNSDGTGTITGTLASGSGCTSTTFSESFVIQQSSRGLASNVFVARTDAGGVATGTLVPQLGGPFSKTALYGTYSETLSGTIGGNAFGGVCNDFFNGNSTVSGSCTLNTATIGKCQFNLEGSYYVLSQGGGAIYSANLNPISGSPVGCLTVPVGELLRILNGTGYGPSFTAGEVAAVSFEANTIEAGTYLPQD